MLFRRNISFCSMDTVWSFRDRLHRIFFVIPSFSVWIYKPACLLYSTVAFCHTETTVGTADPWSMQISFSNSQGYELLYIRVWTDTLQRHKYQKFETNIPRKELRGLSPNSYIHVFCVRFLYSHDRFAYSAAGKKGGPIVGIYRSLPDTWMWKLGLRPLKSFTGNT